MSANVTIKINLSLDSAVTPEIRAALDSLASVMLVQAEDGLYLAGYEDAEEVEIDGETVENEYLAGFDSQSVEVEVVVKQDDATITAANGIRFNVHIVRKGGKYGLDNRLIWDKDEPAVEFYDTRFPHTPLGQFVSSYYVETLIADGPRNECGLNLHGGVADWTIDAVAMSIVRGWLRENV